MTVLQFKGFGGVRLAAATRGDEDAPPVLLIHGLGQGGQDWHAVAVALELAGRRVISLDLRGHGTSEWPSDGRYDVDAFADDIKAVLAQMSVRPVIMASGFGSWLAILALGEEGAHLASGLVVMTGAIGQAAAQQEGTSDPRIAAAADYAAVAQRLTTAAAKLTLPVLCTEDNATAGADAAIIHAIPGVEFAAIEGGEAKLPLDRAESLNGVLLDFLERRVPLAAPEYREGSDARTFRDALGCFATGVTIVTTMGADGVPVGLTANSFTSVSLDPPLLLVCVANTAGSAPILRDAQRFAVNVLQIGQQPTSNRFAGKGEDRFAATPWEMGEFTTPVLTGSLASFECERDALHDGGDHFILVGKVLKARFEPRRDPLLYFRGKYRRLHFA